MSDPCHPGATAIDCKVRGAVNSVKQGGEHGGAFLDMPPYEENRPRGRAPDARQAGVSAGGAWPLAGGTRAGGRPGEVLHSGGTRARRTNA
ncbi:hypothetical protein GCM10017687_81140 [Streptomyces echinatus]